MAMTDQQVLQALSRLYRIVEAGEKGFATAAISVGNRCLKIYFKSFAQQRAKFKSEILGEIRKLGGKTQPRSSIRAAIHRGRIAILAAMTIGEEVQERVVLKEVVIGEKYAIRTYQRTLEKEIPPETRKIIEAQYEEVQKVNEMVNLMRGKDGKRLVIRLFDSENEVEAAIQSLRVAGFAQETIDRSSLSEAVELYDGRGTTVLETVASGAFGGSLWGSLSGIVVGFAVVQLLGLENVELSQMISTWGLIAVSGLLLGALGGAILGLIIGVGISEEDSYLYRQSLKDGLIVFRTVVDESRAYEASQIVDRVPIENNSMG